LAGNSEKLIRLDRAVGYAVTLGATQLQQRVAVSVRPLLQLPVSDTFIAEQHRGLVRERPGSLADHFAQRTARGTSPRHDFPHEVLLILLFVVRR
jgi:hypothetical protein